MINTGDRPIQIGAHYHLAECNKAMAFDREAAFGFTGHYHHGPSGLSFAYFRAYDSSLGRWLNLDPRGELGGLNLFAYT